jgi:hypothetical protein
MSIIHKTRGENITNAITVLKETYENLELLFSELDRVGTEEGFFCLTPRFLRYKSDTDYLGWLTSDFTKLYQRKSDTVAPHLPELREGAIFGIEVELQDEDNGYPVLSIIEYFYDYTYWNRLPSVSDRWVFYCPFRNENEFKIEESNGTWTSVPFDRVKKKYWGLQKAVAYGMPLVEIKSSEDIRDKVFGKMKK